MTDQRVRFSDSDSLISTTTADSHITYCNEDFCNVAGYREEELLGKPHNVIRHNDMPNPAFGQLWEYIQSGKSWMGLVKNKCKDSGHYWVSAFVTPILDKDGRVYEYQSVRTQPSDEQIVRAGSLYTRIKKGNAKIRRIQLMNWIPILAIIQLIGLLLLASGMVAVIASLAVIILLCIGQLILLFRLKSRHSTIHKVAIASYNNPLMEQPYTGHCDDFSAIELAMLMKRAELRAVTARAFDTSADLLDSANEEVVNSKMINSELMEQDIATDAMAVSAEEMLASIDEVDQQAKQSVEFTSNAQKMASKGVQTVNETVETANQLSKELDDSRQALDQLYTDAGSIETILAMIQGIAEQTNLLALNAAIEAARAGEHGRGFAVVADEVRALSIKTSSFVGDIHSKIEVLQATVNRIGTLMEAGKKASDSSVMKAEQSREAFQAIVSDLSAISEQSASTSQAITEQVQVTQGISEHVHRMKEGIGATKSLSGLSLDRTKQLAISLESMQRLVKQFSHS